MKESFDYAKAVAELFPGAGSVRMDTDDIKSVRELDGTEVALIRSPRFLGLLAK